MARRPARKRPARRRLTAAELAPGPARPPDPREVRRRQEAAEVELDNQELLRRRRAVDADLAAALAPAPRPAPASRPAPTSPFLDLPVTRVVHNSPSGLWVIAWGPRIWVPKSATTHHDPDAILEGWSGPLEVSSRWAAGVGLPPPQPAPARSRRTP